MAMKIGAGLIIVLMLLSGAAVFLASQTNTANPNSPTPDAPNLKTYIAQDVKGKITLVLPSAIVGGTTTITDKSVLDEALGDLPGVKAIESRFTELEAGSSVLTYLANVQLSSIDDKDAFAEAMSAFPLLESPEVYFQASVSIPPKLVGVSQSNESKDITLTQTTIQAIVSPQTLKDHDISGAVSTTFQGETLVSAYMLENQNLSLTPSPISLTDTYTISSLSDKYSIAGTWSYIPSFDAQSLKSDIENIPGVVFADEPIIPYVDNLLSLDFVDANAYVDDVNAYVQLHPEQFLTVSGFNNTLNVELGTISLTQAKTDLQSAIESAAATNVEIVFQEPLTQFLVDVNIPTADASQAQAALKDYFDSMGASVDIYQNGQVELSTIMDPDTNAVYDVPNGLVSMVVKPGHAVGDSVWIQISAIAQNGILTYINGVEMTPTDANSTG
jgi:hypothetical protein